MNNQEIINKADQALLAGNSAGGVLGPQQAAKFLDEVFDDSSFLNNISHEKRISVTGSIEKMGIAKGILQKKLENTEPGLSNPFSFPVVPYTCKGVVSALPVSEDFFRQNIEGQSVEDRFMGMMKEQVQLDMLNVVINGDEATATSDALYKTLSIDDGIIKQLKGTPSEVDMSKLYSAFSNSIFIHAVRTLPRKYFNPTKYRWIANHVTYSNWIEWLGQKQTTAGDMAILTGNVMKPLGVDWAILPDFPDDTIILADPKNFCVVNTYDIMLRKTTEGMNAVLKDMRYYALHFNMDTVIYNKEACLMLNNIPSMVPVAKTK